MTVILAPTEAELRGSLDLFSRDHRWEPVEPETKTTENTFLRVLWRGQAGRISKPEEEILLGVCGVGKVQAALALHELITLYYPKKILFGGIGGGLAPGLELGNLLVAGEILQWDMDAEAAGVPWGITPFMEEIPGKLEKGRILLEDEALKNISEPPAGEQKLRYGRFATGDRILGAGERELKSRLYGELGADIVDMESWPVAYVAVKKQLPVIIARIVSDTLEGERAANMRRFTDSASRSLAEFFSSLL